MSEKKTELIVLYQQLADHTLPECQHTCRLPISCCSPEYCALTMDYAKDRWGVELQPTTHKRLPLMGDSGCIAAPHLRPICTMHTCQMNSLGFKPGDPNWTDRYFVLREQIEELEYEIGNQSVGGTSSSG